MGGLNEAHMYDYMKLKEKISGMYSTYIVVSKLRKQTKNSLEPYLNFCINAHLKKKKMRPDKCGLVNSVCLLRDVNWEAGITAHADIQ